MSTDDQRTLKDFHTQPEPRRDATAEDWNPNATPRRCQGCHAHVTRKFQRTHGRNGHVHACLECVNSTWLPEAAANPEIAEQARDQLTEHQARGTAGGHTRGGTDL